MTDQPARVHHPGVILQRELEARHMSHRELAREVGLRQSYVSYLVSGKCRMNAHMAVKLEDLWETSAEMWLSMQMNYDLWVERNKA